MMFAKEIGQLKDAAHTAFADGKLCGDVRFSILQVFIFRERD